METFGIIYFFVCIVVIGFVSLKHVIGKRVKKQKKEQVPTESVNKEQAQTENVNIKKEDLQFTLESVNSWVNNCDQKAGILLTIVGVAITVIMTSDIIKSLRGYIFAPFMEYCSGASDLSFSWSRFTVFLLLVIAITLLIVCCIYLFRAIRADIDNKKRYSENPNLERTSYIFYGDISQMKYDDYKKGGVKFEDDLKSQIYINSKIATTKFRNYNEGLFWFKIMLLVSVMLFIPVMIMI